MKIYQLNSKHPAWHHDPATPRQLKVLRFFDVEFSDSITKGQCAGIINRLFSNSDNKRLWAAYVFTTGDGDCNSADLLPYDRIALANVIVPDDWKPNRGTRESLKPGRQFEELVADILRDGSPFDDPLPEISIQGRVFCFTGNCDFGSREECHSAVASRGGDFTERINSRTDVLVIGNTPNSHWAHGSYGRKILEAMVLRLTRSKPIIIPEIYWKELL